MSRLIQTAALTRRQFLKVTALAGGGLVAACRFTEDSEPVSGLASGPAPLPPAGDPWQANDFIRITLDNKVTVIIGNQEIGQGVSTSVPMLVAEELDADFSLVTWEHSPVGLAYNNPKYVFQMTGASSTILANYLPQRQAGAAVRAMLVQAAANRWAADPAQLRTELSYVIDDAGARRASFGELASEAAALSPPSSPALKEPAQFRLIGKSQRRLDSSAKVNGSAVFGSDLRIPNMLTAVIARPPRLTGRVPAGGDTPLSYDSAAALAVPGVSSVFTVRAGVVVVAKDFWSAKKGRDVLNVQWQASALPHVSSEDQRSRYQQMLDVPGTPVKVSGTADLALLAPGPGVISGDYSFPYLTHAPMETLNVTIDYAPGRCEIWCGTQWPDLDRTLASVELGLTPDQINFHILPSGGGFGRRLSIYADFVSEAAQVAAVLQQPVKVMWTREDDIRGGFYRPSAEIRMRAQLDAAGLPSSWAQRIVAQPLVVDGAVEEAAFLADLEFNSAAGASNQPYEIPNLLVDVHSTTDTVPVLWWRSVSNSFNVHARESFVDELAHAAGQDPVAYRRSLLAAKSRLVAVLDAAVAAAGWPNAPAGHHLGAAVFEAWGSCIAQIAEVSVDAERRLKVHRIVSAADVGLAINPDGLIAQVESAIVFALSAAFFGEITLEDGIPQQNNFNDYPILRMYQTPRLDTVIVNSGAAPGGAGELGVPPVAPAVANAIFRATGERIRALPLKHQFKID